MNKFLAVLVLFAGAACCSAADLNQAEEAEVGLLLGNEKLFIPFCLKERDYITADIKNRVAERSSLVFKQFFSDATEIADEILTVEKEALQEFAKEIASPSQEVDDGVLSENTIQGILDQGKSDIKAIIEKGKSGIREQTRPIGRIMSAAKSAVGPVLYNVANTSLFVRLAQARKILTGKNLLIEIGDACTQVGEYETIIENEFTNAKDQLKAEHPEGEIQKFIDSVSLPSLKCYTIKFITRLSAFCNLFKDGSAPFMKMLGIRFQLPQ